MRFPGQSRFQARSPLGKVRLVSGGPLFEAVRTRGISGEMEAASPPSFRLAKPPMGKRKKGGTGRLRPPPSTSAAHGKESLGG